MHCPIMPPCASACASRTFSRDAIDVRLTGIRSSGLSKAAGSATFAGIKSPTYGAPMETITLYSPGGYDSPESGNMRGRTIAAFHVAQSNADELTAIEMRRDVLSFLMSPKAVDYWLNTCGRLEKFGVLGRVQLLRLTDRGLRICADSIRGHGDRPTTPAAVNDFRNAMLSGRTGWESKTFPALRTSQ